MTKAENRKLANELHSQIKSILKGPTRSSASLGRYVGAKGHPDRKPDEQSKLEYWGHSVPAHRQIMKGAWTLKRGSLALRELPLQDQWQIWLEVWRLATIFDIKNIALSALSAPAFKELREQNEEDLFAMASDIDNWAHSDELSGLLAQALERNPRHFTRFQKWNQDPLPWLRRQSLVGLYFYARLRKKHLHAKKALGLVKKLLDDPHFYVQRGVGWTLREIDRVDSDLQRAFVAKNLSRISSVAWFATSELYPAALKASLVKRRKEERTAKKKTRPNSKKSGSSI